MGHLRVASQVLQRIPHFIRRRLAAVEIGIDRHHRRREGRIRLALLVRREPQGLDDIDVGSIDRLLEAEHHRQAKAQRFRSFELKPPIDLHAARASCFPPPQGYGV